MHPGDECTQGWPGSEPPPGRSLDSVLTAPGPAQVPSWECTASQTSGCTSPVRGEPASTVCVAAEAAQSLSFIPTQEVLLLGGLGHSQGLTAAQGSLRRTTCEKGNRPGAWQEEQGRGGEDAGAHLGSRCCSRHLPGINPFNLPETPMRWQAL